MKINLDDRQIAYINYELQTIANRLLEQLKKNGSVSSVVELIALQRLERVLEYVLRLQAILEAWCQFALLDKDLKRRNETIHYIDSLLQYSNNVLGTLGFINDEAVAEPVDTD